MEKKQRLSIKSLAAAAVALLIVIAVVIIVFVMDSTVNALHSDSAPALQTSEGAAYIERMEAVPAAQIEERIRAEEQAKIDEARLQEMLSDPDQIFSWIRENNVVLVGESRTSGFQYYGWLDENHFLGGVGWSVLEIPGLFDRIAALQPSALVFCFGINEMPREIGAPVAIPTPEIFMDTIQGSFDAITGLVPGVKIYMNCIVPCSEVGYREAPGFTVIPEWNEYIRNYCAEHGYGYIDITDLCEEHADMYREDGMHLVSEFYPYWGARILETIYSDR